jgi:3-deoxy-D-manno-octulosonic acid kinase
MVELVRRELRCGIALSLAGTGLEPIEDWFDKEFWLGGGAEVHSSTGRVNVLIGQPEGVRWVLRHYHRGGLVARFIDDHYWWCGLERTRAYRELGLLGAMQQWGLPSPPPVAACVRRAGLFYQADIITGYLANTRTLSAYIRDEGVADDTWRRIGRMVKQFHDHGVQHPDLTAHNILINDEGRVFLVDFDSAVLREAGNWRKRGIARLERSLRKVALETGTQFDPDGWKTLVTAYHAG